MLPPLTAARPARLSPRQLSDRIREIPQQDLIGYAARLYTLCNLAWIYIDTVCDMNAISRNGGRGARAAVRELRSLRRDYDSFRNHFISSKGMEEETQRAERIEDELIQTRLKAHRNELSERIERKLALCGEERLYYIAYHLAWTIYRSCLRYSDQLTGEVSRQIGSDIPRHALLADQIEAIETPLRALRPADWHPWRDIMHRTGAHLLKRLREIQLVII